MRIIALMQHLDRRYQFFEWFAGAWQKSGGMIKRDIYLPRKIRALFGRPLGVAVRKSDRPKLLVCGCHRIESCAWPWNYQYEIVPVMWDLWPGFYEFFAQFIVRNDVHYVFCTASQSVRWLQERFPSVKCTWLPEAIDVKSFPAGPRLKDRRVDVCCYGRSAPQVEPALKRLAALHGESSIVRRCGESIDELSEMIRNSKIAICFPRCDTDVNAADKARGVETLTQRYWEAMCSGTLPVGRAPKELVDLCGYNPVIPFSVDDAGMMENY